MKLVTTWPTLGGWVASQPPKVVPTTMAAEDVLHDLATISMIGSDRLRRLGR